MVFTKDGHVRYRPRRLPRRLRRIRRRRRPDSDGRPVVTRSDRRGRPTRSMKSRRPDRPRRSLRARILRGIALGLVLVASPLEIPRRNSVDSRRAPVGRHAEIDTGSEGGAGVASELCERGSPAHRARMRATLLRRRSRRHRSTRTVSRGPSPGFPPRIRVLRPRDYRRSPRSRSARSRTPRRGTAGIDARREGGLAFSRPSRANARYSLRRRSRRHRSTRTVSRILCWRGRGARPSVGRRGNLCFLRTTAQRGSDAPGLRLLGRFAPGRPRIAGEDTGAPSLPVSIADEDLPRAARVSERTRGISSGPVRGRRGRRARPSGC